MFMLVNKRPYRTCGNDVKMSDSEEKIKFILVNRVIESYSRPIKVK